MANEHRLNQIRMKN